MDAAAAAGAEGEGVLLEDVGVGGLAGASRPGD